MTPKEQEVFDSFKRRFETTLADAHASGGISDENTEWEVMLAVLKITAEEMQTRNSKYLYGNLVHFV